jgi:hypothetical protein
MMFTSLREFSASGNPEVVSAPIMRQTSEETHLVLRAVQIATVRGVRDMPESAAERFIYGQAWDKLSELEVNFDKKYPFTDEPLDIAGISTTFTDTWKRGNWSPSEKFDMGKYQDLVRRAKPSNTNETDQVTQAWMMSQCLGLGFFLSQTL